MSARESQVSRVIREANESRRGALIGYLPIGFPDLDTSVEAAIAMARNGVDVIELGIPYSDPVMDGVVIQEATLTALNEGFHVSQAFEAVRRVREAVDTPVLIMTYWNPVMQYGVDRFAQDLAAAGGAGLITPDITPDSADDWIVVSEAHGLDRVFLAAPTSADDRLEMIARSATGFIYTVSTMGITGERAQLDAAARRLTERLREHGAELACVGIGISTADQVAAALEYADGAIVGTVFVRALRDVGVEGLAATVREIAAGTVR
ncbi:tryptophan synthase subunit alpha [Leucobacter coleopterorum]|uniref:Tryptophan synthase alpha chain n=1 Tax=Leucobacter coleopterorum TaxID=2714933 RepID=A0ABX6JVN6_9MICO|nr:tryptophan synthase subunit alpha [Leucobacter coleopterorum]QIM18358.1 tryptophan synthase subunit alpha [Leucobacter coleopterorum]